MESEKLNEAVLVDASRFTPAQMLAQQICSIPNS